MLDFHLQKSYGPFALDIAATVAEGEWLVLLAPSGSGKSLTLDLIAGIVRPDGGYVRQNGNALYDASRGINLTIRKRQLGYVFQDSTLFPHMTVSQNIAYGIPRAGQPGDIVRKWLAFFHLEGREGAYPGELSGGQKQRVALARTLASKPKVLLLDEPFSALDRRIRESLQQDLAELKNELTISTILVTHDFDEAQILGDRVAVLENGQLLETGAKARLFAHPQKHQTARFLGVENVMAAKVAAQFGPDSMTIHCGELGLTMPLDSNFSSGEDAYLCIRAGDVRLVVDERERPNAFTLRLDSIAPAGGTNRVTLTHPSAASTRLVMLMDDYVLGRYAFVAGSSVKIWLPPEKLFLCV